MKTIFFTFFFIFAVQSKAQTSGFGLGAMIGDPTAFSFKGHLGNSRYFDAALAYATGPADELFIHGNYLFERSDLIRIDRATADLYYGIGARLYWADHKDDKNELHLGPRAPIGVSHYFKNPNVEVFGELAFIMNIIPETEADFDFSIGARYWF